ncbi:hypothetical protein PCE1_001890 [Barthelona sp. PCE]
MSAQKVLFAEYIPSLSPKNSLGGLLVIFSDGEVSWIPDNTLFGRNYVNCQKISNPNAKGTHPLIALWHPANGYDVYSSYIADLTSRHYSFAKIDFPRTKDDRNIVPPRKIALSPNKQYLLILGVNNEDESTLLNVYNIQSTSSQIELIIVFSDFGELYRDVCFFPNSRGIACITQVMPNCITLINIVENNTSVIPRPFTMSTLGPARDVNGKNLVFDGIEVNPVLSDLYPHGIHYVTWSNQRSKGDVVAWCVYRCELTTKLKESKDDFFNYSPDEEGNLPQLFYHYRYQPFQLELTSSCYVHKMMFSTQSGLGSFKVFGVLQRRNDGIRVFNVDLHHESPCKLSFISFPTRPTNILFTSFQQTFVLGNFPSFQIAFKDLGIFEIANDFVFEFKHSIPFFLGLGKYKRLYIDNDRRLHIMFVDPEDYSDESKDLYSHFLDEKDLNRQQRVLSVGYAPWGESELDDIKTMTMSRVVVAERIEGLHLFRCQYCGKTMIKPLRCKTCKKVAYCSDQCHKAHWSIHQNQCLLMSKRTKE